MDDPLVRQLREPLDVDPLFTERLEDAAEAAEQSTADRERTAQAQVENAIAEESGEYPPNSTPDEDSGSVDNNFIF